MMSVIIERNTSAPAKYTKPYTTCEDNQTTVLIKVFEGEHKMTKYNNLLGKFELTGIQPAPCGVPHLVVTFEINSNGILDVTAVEKSGGKMNNLITAINKGRLTKEEIDQLVKDAKYYRDEDEKDKERSNIALL
jgi:molecular chaperone DnaK (HSP70)